MHPPTIDIVIVNYRSVDDTLQGLMRLGAWPYGTVWLVDNSEDDLERDRLSDAVAHMAWVCLLVPDKNLGFGKGCNLAFEQSRSDYFLLLNPDARIDPANILLLASALEQNVGIAAVSPVTFWNESRTFTIPHTFDQTPWSGVRSAITSRCRWAARLISIFYLKRMQKLSQRQRVFDVDFLTGAVLMLRRKTIVDVGGLFDPDYFMFYEDSDLSHRLRRAGHQLAIVPTAAAIHEYRHKRFKEELMAQARHLYFSKQFPLFYRLSNRLTRLDALTRPVSPTAWFEVLNGPIYSLRDFFEQSKGAFVLAFSPSLLMMPVIFRPVDVVCNGFSDEEWALLEPGSYVALIKGTANGRVRQRWVYFERGD
jgi:GT2 family glycosyltransferase